MLDTLNRRIRFAPPAPIAGCIVSKKDLRLFEALRQHGPLPTHYLHAFVGGNRINFRHHLRTLFDHGYLIRPSEYFDSFFARYQSLVYDLGDKGLEATGKEKVVRTDHAIHRLMCACVMASIELMCREKGIGFIPREDVTNGASLRFDLSKAQSRDFLEPDDVFGLHFPGAKHYYAVEIDRGTEQLQSARNRKTLEDTFSAYEEIFDERPYEEQWGRKNLHALIVTTNEVRAASMKKLAGKKFHFKVYENFASPWRMPQIYTDVLDGLI